MSSDFLGIYRPLVTQELNSLLPKGSFTSFLSKQVGAELHGVLEGSEYRDDEICEIPFLASKLYLLLSGGWVFDHQWLENKDGTYTADDGKRLPTDVALSISPTEHLAAFGLWQLSEEYDSIGFFPSEGEKLNDHGFSIEEITRHKTERVLVAYQSLVYAQKILIGENSDPEAIQKAALIANARKAADVRHSKPGGARDKRQQIREIWASGKYSSRDICAEQECAALGMAFSTARKALVGTPDFG